MVFLIDEENDELTFVEDDEIIDGIIDLLVNMEDEDFED